VRGLLLVVFVQFCSISAAQVGLQFELTGKRPPIVASGIASINQKGIVFNPEPGRAGYIRYRWSDFTAKGLGSLLARIPLERAFLQKDAATRLELIDYIRAEITIKLPQPVNRVVEAPVKSPVENIVLPPAVQESPPPAPIILAALPKPAPPTVPKQNQEVTQGSDEENSGRKGGEKPDKTFSLVPGPVVDAPPPGRLGSGTWLSISGLILLSTFLSLSAYAGYEIALFRHRPARVVCALSAIFPIIVPLVVLLMPDPAEIRAEVMAEENDRYIIHPQSELKKDAVRTEAQECETQLIERAAEEEGGAVLTAVERYHSGRTQFSDRFFSEHLSRFYQSAPPEGQILYIQTTECLFPVHHISTLEPESLAIVYTSGEEWLEQAIEYGSIEEVRVEGVS
tara:strand:- start:505 stop:1695 length:1191 start_codon:yes stop_codon:yes gene_type:complete